MVICLYLRIASGGALGIAASRNLESSDGRGSKWALAAMTALHGGAMVSTVSSSQLE
jgi:hypothetical protein